MSDAYHRPVFEIAAHIWSNAGGLSIQMVKQLTFLGNDPRVVPLTGFNLHDDHASWRRAAFYEALFLPVIEIEVVRILAFPPRVIDTEIGQRYALGRMPVHDQSPAVVRAKDERAAD